VITPDGCAVDFYALMPSLAEGGLRLDCYLTEDRNWFRAVPADAPVR